VHRIGPGESGCFLAVNEVELGVYSGFFEVLWGKIFDLGSVGSFQFFKTLASDQFFELRLRLIS
jgi:hypothetical protein